MPEVDNTVAPEATPAAIPEASVSPVAVPTAEPAPTPEPLPVVAIPAQATAEIIRLHQDLVTKAKAMEESRSGFNAFIRAVRMTLQIPNGEPWDLLPDASALRKMPTPPPAGNTSTPKA